MGAKEAEERRQATWGTTNTTVDSRLAGIDAFLARHCDYKHRFAGHANSETDIKEAAFLGSEYIASGSDCGNVFIWHRSGRLVYLGKGDQYIVNCVQPNPHMSTLACSGIDQHIRLFTPTCPEKADGFTLNTDQTFMAEICNENLRRAANTNDLQYSDLLEMFRDPERLREMGAEQAASCA